MWFYAVWWSLTRGVSGKAGAGMSDPQHLLILMQGVDAWNEWREANLEVTPNLKRADLEGFELSGANLQGANLRWTILREANLQDANLRGAILCHADLKGADLSGADIRSADLYAVDLSAAILNDTITGPSNFDRTTSFPSGKKE
jgi:uncharacterized protein YjbI with pentapeptide repeats